MANVANEEAAAQAMQRQQFLRDASDLGETRLKDLLTFDQYYVGEQKTLLMERARLYLRRSGFTFAENFCETIVDVMCERIRLESFSVEGDQPDTASGDDDETAELDQGDALAEWLGDVFEANRIDGKQGIVHTQTAVKSECGVLVDWDTENARPRITFQRPEILKFVYDDDDPDCLLYVSKVWNSTWKPPVEGSDLPQGGSESMASGTPIRRMNIYFPDRVEKWFSAETDGSRSANWHVWMDEGDTGWPVSWVRSDGSPLGIPVVHFRNKSKGARAGRSELRGVIPQQDLLNKLILDLAAVIDYEGMPGRWATGVPDADNSVFKYAPGEVWVSSSENAKFGEFTGSDPTPLNNVIDGTLRRMAARSHTPLHLLNPTGVIPSGESLKTAEAPLVRKCQDRQTDWGNDWEDVAQLCVRLHNTFSTEPEWDESLIIQAEWDSAESRNDLGEAQTAQIWHDIGASAHTLLTRAGFDPAEEAERRAEEAQSSMDRGLLAGLPVGPAPVVSPPGSYDAPAPAVEQ